MWLMKAPEGTNWFNATGFAFGLPIKQGYIMVEKQYWWKFLKDRRFEDVTPTGMSGHLPQERDPQSLLVIRWGGYGDILMCLPVIRRLKAMYPELKVTFAGMDIHAQVLKEHPLVDFVLLPPAHQIGNMVEMYDLVYDLSGIIPCNPESDYKNAYDLHFEWLGFQPENIPDEEKVVDFVVTQEEEEFVKGELGKLSIEEDDFIILFNPKSSTELRNLPYDKAREAITRIAEANPEAKIIVSAMQDAICYRGRFKCNKCKVEQFPGVKGEVEGDRKIPHTCTSCGETIYITPHNYHGKVPGGGQRIKWHKIPENVYFPAFSFRHFCAMVERADLVVTVDSAPLHVAGLLERPTLGIFSSFDGSLRAKYFPNTTWIQWDFRCAPCFQHNIVCWKLQTEKKSFSPCMDSIPPELIAEETQKLVEKVKKEKEEKNEIFSLSLEKPEDFILPNSEDISCFACSTVGDVTLSFRKGKFSYWRCNHCGSMFVWPRPTLEYLTENYQNPDYNIVFNDLEGIRKVAHIVNVAFGAKYDFRGKILEIGANVGWFGQEIKRLGWNYTGVEISKDSVARCRKKGLQKNMILGSVEDGEVFTKVQERAPFDFFVIHNTIEHLVNPVSLLQTLSSIASDDATFSISTPCVDFWDGKNTWQHINPFFAGEHCSLLSKEGMKLLARRTGLGIVSTEEFRGTNEIWYRLQQKEKERV